MLDISVYQDRSGFWAWEVLDEEGVYIRSCRKREIPGTCSVD